MASRQFATFEVANQLFGVEVHTVQEVLSEGGKERGPRGRGEQSGGLGRQLLLGDG